MKPARIAIIDDHDLVLVAFRALISESAYLVLTHQVKTVSKLIKNECDVDLAVLELYASGVGAKQVATQLHISENTVNDHLQRIKRVYRDLGRPAATKV